MGPLRKTKLIAELEKKHNKDIRDLITEALTLHPSIRLAANSLGISPDTFYYWMLRLQIHTKRVVTIETDVA